MIGTAGSWFFLDVAYYGLGLNSAVILTTIGYASSPNVYKSLYNQAVGNLILICAGSLPGYWVSAATLDIIGRKPVQLGGFIILTVLFVVLGFAYNKISDHGKLALYVLAQFFQNFVLTPPLSSSLVRFSQPDTDLLLTVCLLLLVRLVLLLLKLVSVL